MTVFGTERLHRIEDCVRHAITNSVHGLLICLVVIEAPPKSLLRLYLVGDQERPIAGHIEQGQFLVTGDTLARRIATKIVGNADGGAELLLT